MYYTPGGTQLSHMPTVDLARALLPTASAEWVQEQVPAPPPNQVIKTVYILKTSVRSHSACSPSC